MGIADIKNPSNAHMFHVAGQVKEKWRQGDHNFFSDENDMITLSVMADFSCLLYSKNAKPDFEKYFFDYKILYHKDWNPAFNIEGHVLWDMHVDDGLYLIGDHNVCGIEDSYITGLCAANHIIEDRKNRK